MKTLRFFLSSVILIFIPSFSGHRHILSPDQEEWSKSIQGAVYMICFLKFLFQNLDQENDDCIEDDDEDAEEMTEEEYNKPGTQHPRVDELYSKPVMKYLKENNYRILRLYSGDKKKSFIAISHDSVKAFEKLKFLNLRAKKYEDIEPKQTLLAPPKFDK